MIIKAYTKEIDISTQRSTLRGNNIAAHRYFHAG